MNETALQEIVRKLPRRRAEVYNVILERGPITDLEISHIVDPEGDPGAARGRRAELVKAGLVRASNKRGSQQMWEATAADEIEVAREAAERRAPRVRDISKRPLDVRVRAFLTLARDQEVQEAVANPESAARRRDRARLRDVLRQDERERRERARELREAAQRGDGHVEFIRFRNALRDADDRVRALRVLFEERLLVGDTFAVPAARWAEVADLLVEGVRHHEELYELVARLAGRPSRKEADFEYGDDEIIEDAEVLELIAAAGEDAVTDD